MKTNQTSPCGFFNPRILLAFGFCSVGTLLAMLSFAANPSKDVTGSANPFGDSPFVDKYAGRLNGSIKKPPSTPLGPSTGPGWSLIASPNNGTHSNILFGVTCVSASDCWAVGDYKNNNGVPQTLTEHWNGTLWSLITSPNTGTMDNILRSVTCVSASDCWAVGYYVNSGGTAFQTLIEQWDGSSWSIITSPNSGTESNALYGVTCVSASDCWAVGAAGVSAVLREHWNGTSWTATSFGATTLYGVTCVSTSVCWDVGYKQSNSNPTQTLVDQYNGSNWLTRFSPNNTVGNNILNSVTCTSASQCLAVGEYGLTLIEQWNGTSWSIVTSPNVGTGTNTLYGVTCVSASDCWAVGYYDNGTGGVAHDQTLIEKYSLAIPPLTSVGSRMTHGSITPPFDISLPLTGTRGVECRSSASLGAGNSAVVFTFVNNVTSCGTAGTTGGSVSSGPNPNQCTENLTSVPDAQYTTVTLNNVLDAQNNTGNVSAQMGVLVGDVTSNGLAESDASAGDRHELPVRCECQRPD